MLRIWRYINALIAWVGLISMVIGILGLAVSVWLNGYFKVSGHLFLSGFLLFILSLLLWAIVEVLDVGTRGNRRG